MSDAKKGGRPSRKEYRRVRDTKPEGEKTTTKENEVRVVASRGQRMYIKYAIDILTGTEGKTKSDSVILSGMGNAVYNVVNVVEILKRRVKGLHQTTEISSQTMTDKYEAVDKEKEGLEVERKVSVIEIVLSTTPLDTNHPGYQEPLPESEVTEQDDRVDAPRERRPRKKAAPKKDAKKGDNKKGDKKDAPKKDAKKGDDKKGGRGGDKKKDDKKGGKKEEAKGGRRGGNDRRDDRAPARGGRGGRGGNDRDDRAPARGGRGGRGGNDRNDRRDDRAPARGGRGGRGGNSEGRREGGRGAGRSDRGRR